MRKRGESKMTSRFLAHEGIELTFIEIGEKSQIEGGGTGLRKKKLRPWFCTCSVWNALAVKWRSEIGSWIHESGLQGRGPDRRNKFGSQEKEWTKVPIAAHRVSRIRIRNWHWICQHRVCETEQIGVNSGKNERKRSGGNSFKGVFL